MRVFAGSVKQKHISEVNKKVRKTEQKLLVIIGAVGASGGGEVVGLHHRLLGDLFTNFCSIIRPDLDNHGDCSLMTNSTRPRTVSLVSFFIGKLYARGGRDKHFYFRCWR